MFSGSRSELVTPARAGAAQHRGQPVLHRARGVGVVRAADPAVGVPVGRSARAAAVRRRRRPGLAGRAPAAPAGDLQAVSGGASGPSELHELTPNPLRSDGVEPWTEHMVPMQQHLRHQTMAEKQVFLGVRLTRRPPSHRLIAAVWRHPGNIEHARLLSQVERVTETRRAAGAGGPAGDGGGDGVAAAPLDRDRAARPGGLVAGRGGRVGVRRPAHLHRRGRLRRAAVRPHGAADRPRSRRSDVERHVAVMSVGRLEEIEAPDPGHEPWLSHTDRLPFPVEWSCQFRRALRCRRPGRRSSASCWWSATCSGTTREHDLDEPLALDRQARRPARSRTR